MPADARRVPAPHVSPGKTDELAGRDRLHDRDGARVGVSGVLHHADGVGAFRKRGSRHDPHGLSGSHRALEQVARRHGTDHMESDRCGRGVGRTQGVPVHGRIRERWDVLARDDVLAEDAPERIAERDPLRRQTCTP